MTITVNSCCLLLACSWLGFCRVRAARWEGTRPRSQLSPQLWMGDYTWGAGYGQVPSREAALPRYIAKLLLASFPLLSVLSFIMALSKFRWVEIVRGAPELAATIMISHSELCVVKMPQHPTHISASLFSSWSPFKWLSLHLCFVKCRCGCRDTGLLHTSLNYYLHVTENQVKMSWKSSEMFFLVKYGNKLYYIVLKCLHIAQITCLSVDV